MPRLPPMEAAAQRGKASPLSLAPLGSSPKGRGVTAGDGEGEDACEGQAVFVLAFLTGDVPSPPPLPRSDDGEGSLS